VELGIDHRAYAFGLRLQVRIREHMEWNNPYLEDRHRAVTAARYGSTPGPVDLDNGVLWIPGRHDRPSYYDMDFECWHWSKLGAERLRREYAAHDGRPDEYEPPGPDEPPF
jgi:hypothetical protein